MTVIVLLSALMTVSQPAPAQQVPDTGFAPPIGAPRYPAGHGPTVVIDAAHLNFHTADGGYSTFARLLGRDGYRVKGNDKAFSAESLEGTDILVIVNAMHPQSELDWAPLPNHSAFTEPEIAAVEQWVRGGGALLLIADHMPLAGHAAEMAEAFGVRFQNGFALDSAMKGRITFRRDDESLPPNVISDGRHATERVDSATSFTGQAFRIDPDVNAQAVLVVPEGHTLFLPSVAWEFSDSTPRVSAARLLQGAVLHHGQGRVAVFGEAAMFTAQLAGPQRVPVGMNDPQAPHNYRLVLNVLHWLSSGTP
jgi:hypothetical protein